MCIDDAGEILAIEFYGTQSTRGGCDWDFQHPFVRIELDTVEPVTGLRFPSRVETIVPRAGGASIFTQRFKSYSIAEVEAQERISGVVPGAK